MARPPRAAVRRNACVEGIAYPASQTVAIRICIQNCAKTFFGNVLAVNGMDGHHFGGGDLHISEAQRVAAMNLRCRRPSKARLGHAWGRIPIQARQVWDALTPFTLPSVSAGSQPVVFSNSQGMVQNSPQRLR